MLKLIKKEYIIALLLVGLGLIVGYIIGESSDRSHSHGKELRMNSYLSTKLTSPLLECAELPKELSIGDRAVIEKKVAAYVAQAKKIGHITHAAVYFRDLNNGPWFGINERDPFTPGSLLKLPLAMSIMRMRVVPETTGILDRTVEVSGPTAPLATESVFDSDKPLAPGVYSVRNLVGLMLRESSNQAAETLVSVVGKEQVFGIYADLGIEEPSLGKDYQIDVKTFGAFFRVLYNASFAGQRGSEEILTLLTQSTYRDGLVAGVPSDVLVAHKYGTREVPGVPDGRQLHDCGIVYAKETPYVLCIMTRGNSVANLSSFIARVSGIVYEGVAD